MTASYSGGGGRVSAAVRVNGELRSVATAFPAHAVFPIYSITKTLTAICVLRLVETRSLRLADAARQWLADRSIPTAITLTHLLRHTSGGMGVYADRSSRRGQNYHHGGGGPGYNLAATIYPDTQVGRVSIALFVNSICEPRADECEATLLARLLDQGV